MGNLICIVDDCYEGSCDDTDYNKTASQLMERPVYGPAAIAYRNADRQASFLEVDDYYTSLSAKAMNEILEVLLHKGSM